MFHTLAMGDGTWYNNVENLRQTVTTFSPEESEKGGFGIVLRVRNSFRKGGCSMEVIFMILEVMAIAADIVTICMFIESRIEKRADKKVK